KLICSPQSLEGCHQGVNCVGARNRSNLEAKRTCAEPPSRSLPHLNSAVWLMSDHSRPLFARRDHRFAFALLWPSNRGQRRGQRLDEQLVDRLDRNNFQPTLYIVGDLGEIFLVFL